MSKQQPVLDLSSFNPLPYIKGVIRKNTQNYNMALLQMQKMKAKLIQQEQSGVIIPGVKNTFISRKEGMKNITTLHQRAWQGFLWLPYFLYTPEPILQQHVENGLKFWALESLKVPNPTSLFKAAVTTTMIEKGDIQNLTLMQKQIVQYQIKTMIVSSVVSFSIASLLKQMAKASKQEIRKQMFNVSRRTWQFTGIIAVAHNLGCIGDAMRELGPFEKSMRKDRDDVLKQRGQEFQAKLESLIPSEEDRRDLLALMNE